MTALIVENDPSMSELIARGLSGMGFDFCEHCGALKDAIKMLSTVRFDLICLDLKLDDSDADATAESLAVISSFSGETPILVITGYPSRLPSRARAYAAEVLSKPFHGQHFDEAVQNAMRRPASKSIFPASLLAASMGHTLQLRHA